MEVGARERGRRDRYEKTKAWWQDSGNWDRRGHYSKIRESGGMVIPLVSRKQ